MSTSQSSFVNVTLSFWTNGNGLSISPENVQSLNDNSLLSATTKEDPIANDTHQSSVGSKISNSIVGNLISDLLGDGHQLAGEIQGQGSISNISNLAQALIDNVTGQVNSTSCPGDLQPNDCISNSTGIPIDSRPDRVYWALFLIILPVLALFGNILVILSVYKERSLQTVTNWFIVSLAFADLFVTIPMVFSVYVLVNVDWELSELLCDLYIAIDVICSTASIFNLVAISFDRYIAVTHPIFYSKHKNDKRVIFTIVIVWMASAGVGMPIMLGANTSPERIPELCIFYNSNFIIYSSLWSFYVPCVIMVILYYKIFKAIHNRAKKVIGSRKTYASGSDSTKSVLAVENASQTKKQHPEELASAGNSTKPAANSQIKAKLPLITETDVITNTGSGSQNEEDDDDDDDEKEGDGPLEIVECHIIKNENKEETEYMLDVKTRAERMKKPNTNKPNANTELAVQSPIEVEVTIGPNGNTDSGYAPSNIEETQFVQNPNTESLTDRPSSPVCPKPDAADDGEQNTNKNNITKVSPASRTPDSTHATGHNHRHRHNDSVSHSGSTTASTGASLNAHMRQPKKKSRFNLGRKHKSSRKKREKASAKRERKATKTLAIVLGVFLLCWTPFFSCNILDAICIKLHENKFIETDCRPDLAAFFLTTWLGYMNSCVNPLIYTIFNPEFRKAFRKILTHSK